jgi:arylsulfatase
VDNVGWGTFGAYGGTIPTPRIDKLASEGIRFNNYNVEVQCTPSRSAIMTGRYSVRSGTFTVPWPGQGEAGLAPWEYTIAELLSDAGYATALYGKWHLGEHQGRLPNDQGFDEWWGVKNTLDEAAYTAWPLFKESGMPVPMIWEGKKGEPSKPVMPLDLKVRPVLDGQYIIPKTVEYIKRNAAAKKPFFVYVGYSEMHPPVIANPDFAGKSAQRGGPFADVIAEMDYRVGEVLDAVKEAGVDDNTIVILSSDNAGGGCVPKWKIYKTIFRYTDNTQSPAIQSGFIQPQFPMFFDLSSDPHEDNNLFYTDLTNGWMLAPDFKLQHQGRRGL